MLAFTLEPKAKSFVVYPFVAKATRPEEPNKGEDVLTPVSEQKHLNMCWTLQPALSTDSFQGSNACSLKANQFSLLTRLLQILDSAKEKRLHPTFTDFRNLSLAPGLSPRAPPLTAADPAPSPGSSPLSLQRAIPSCTAHAAQQHRASIGGLRLSAERASSPALLTLQCCKQPSRAAPPIPHQIPPAVRAFVRHSSFLRSCLAPPTSLYAPTQTALQCVNTLSPAHSSDPVLPRPHLSRSLRAVPPIARLMYFLARAAV